MYPYPSGQKRHQQKTFGGTLQCLLLILMLLGLSALVVGLLAVWQFWYIPNNAKQHPTPSPVVARPSPTTSTANLTQRIDTYIQHLTQTQQIGQLLMLAVYTNNYTSAFDQPLQQWDIANAIMYNQYNGGPLMPTTLSAFTQITH